MDGSVLGTLQVPPAAGAGNYFGFLDVSRDRRKPLPLEVDGFPKGLEGFTLDGEFKGGEDLYCEGYPPQFHFALRRGGLNDPNDLMEPRGVQGMDRVFTSNSTTRNTP